MSRHLALMLVRVVLNSGQCDQMARSFLNAWQKFAKASSKFSPILNNTQNIAEGFQNFAKCPEISSNLVTLIPG